MALSLRLASEAALPASNFNDATRDRRFFPRLAVPLFRTPQANARGIFTCAMPCLPRHPRLELGPTWSAFGKNGPRFGVGIRSNLSIGAFSSREPDSTSLENALGRACFAPSWRLERWQSGRSHRTRNAA